MKPVKLERFKHNDTGEVFYQTEDGSVLLIQADYRVALRTIPSRDIDAIITDPPYGIDYTHSGSHACRFSGVGVTKASKARGVPRIIGDDSPFDPQPLIGLCENVLMWGADHFYPRLPDSGRFLAWNKLGDMEPWDSFSDVEFAWHSEDKAARIFNMKWKGIACDKAGENNGLRQHPMQKPLALMHWCIEESGVESGETVLDPYMGSGTTGIACVRTGCKFIGVEIEPKYFEIAVKRIEAELSRTPLFEPAPVIQRTFA